MPSTFVVGAGPVATALAGALRLGGVPVLGLWARKAAAARAAGAVSGVAAFSSAPPDLLLESEVVIIAVRDDAIESVAKTLVATGLITRRHVLIHCSGVMSAEEAFADVRERVGGAAILHPLRAIPDGAAAMRSLSGTVFGIEGDAVGLRQARALAQAVGGSALELSGDQMAAYHAAASVASNFLVALLSAATTLLERVGISGPDGVNALLPLVEGTVANVREHGLAGGLTGPIRRGDAATIRRHLRTLPPELSELYRALGRRLVAMTRDIGDVSEEKLDEIDALLDGNSDSRVELGA